MAIDGGSPALSNKKIRPRHEVGGGCILFQEWCLCGVGLFDALFQQPSPEIIQKGIVPVIPSRAPDVVRCLKTRISLVLGAVPLAPAVCCRALLPAPGQGQGDSFFYSYYQQV